MWQMLQRFCSIVKLMYRKFEKVANFLSFKHEKMCILKDKYLPNTSKFELFGSPSKCLFVWSITMALDRCFYLGIISFPQNWNNTQLLKCSRKYTASGYFANVPREIVGGWLMLMADVEVSSIISNFRILKIFIPF